MTRGSLALACILFILLSIPFIDAAGIYEDEAFFAAPIHDPGTAFHRVRIFQRDYPLMLLTYLGALKTWLYAGIFALLPPTVWSLRLPVVLLGAASVFLFFRVTESLAGRRAAIAGAFLLATDPVYLLTNVYDWGPVAIQHVCLTGAVLALARFAQTESRRSLAIAFALIGLGLWDKALFLWNLAGLAAALLMVYPGDVRYRLNSRNARIAVIAFLLGALPLVLYNIRRGGATARANLSLTTSEYGQKFEHLKITANGSSLFGFLVHEEWETHARPAETRLGRAGAAVRNLAGEQRFSWFPYAFVLALALTPVWWRTASRRVLTASWIFLAAAWLLMASTRDAGGSAHHVILLWPVPVFFVATALAASTERMPRAIPIAIVVLLCVQNLLVLNQYHLQLERNGASTNWSRAIFTLADALAGSEDRIYSVDWGIVNPVRLLHDGRLDLRLTPDATRNDELTDRERDELRRLFSDPKALFVHHHNPADEVFTGAGARLDRLAAVEGKVRAVERVIADPNGRPIFDVFRFRSP
ncbi:MAG: glycosyltransferase family 39 protein [Bryobacteraceae bacterium]|nr:glycosyltransferase family 39 protein [Bryobacteraceae bacterium]